MFVMLNGEESELIFTYFANIKVSLHGLFVKSKMQKLIIWFMK